MARKSPGRFHQDFREQQLLVKVDNNLAIALIPELHKGHEDECPQLLENVYALAGMLLGSRFIAQSKHSGCPAGEFENLTIDAQ